MLPFLLKHDHDKLSALRRHATVLTNIIINMSKSTWLLMMYSALAMKGLPVAMNSLPLDMARLQSGKCLRAQGISGQQAGAAKPSMLSSCIVSRKVSKRTWKVSIRMKGECTAARHTAEPWA
eukprot:1137893-Pelagomonas_calceolata.AAC.6